MRFFIAAAVIAIVASLASALFFMLRSDRGDARQDKEQGRRMATALAVRVALSIVLFVCILLAWKLGYIQPGGLPVQH